MKRARELSAQYRLLIVGVIVSATLALSGGSAGAVDRVAGVEIGSMGTSAVVLPDLSMPAGMLVTADGRELWARDDKE